MFVQQSRTADFTWWWHHTIYSDKLLNTYGIYTMLHSVVQMVTRLTVPWANAGAWWSRCISPAKPLHVIFAATAFANAPSVGHSLPGLACPPLLLFTSSSLLMPQAQDLARAIKVAEHEIGQMDSSINYMQMQLHTMCSRTLHTKALSQRLVKEMDMLHRVCLSQFSFWGM